MRLEFKLNRDSAVIPTRGTPGAAGLDLYAAETAVLQKGEWKVVDTGVSVSLPVDHVGLIWPRSGWSVKHGIDTLAGVVDSDYRGSIGVVLINHGPEFVIEPGRRIAQLVVQRYEYATPDIVSELGETLRGEHGYGSTGS